jgi:hypothetical protein
MNGQRTCTTDPTGNERLSVRVRTGKRADEWPAYAYERANEGMNNRSY